jgi:site-specific DNA-methyltransferase (adenine-specific)
VRRRPSRGSARVAAQVRAQIGVGVSDSVSCADWRDLAASLRPRTIDFVYADPPFNTGSVRRTPPGAGKAGRAVDTRYEDSWPDMASYVAWLRERVSATIPAMKASGSIAIHCDQRACHHLRLMLDELLGARCFVNHLIWSYGLGGSSPRRFARKHDDILVYGVTPEGHHFEPPMVPATSRRMQGLMKKATDVLDIPAINNMAAERVGYPTQKPLAMLEMLVGAFCPPGGVVLDPCCGSGTTLVAAARTGRRWIGGDVNRAAVDAARDRLGREASAGMTAGPDLPSSG